MIPSLAWASQKENEYKNRSKHTNEVTGAWGKGTMRWSL